MCIISRICCLTFPNASVMIEPWKTKTTSDRPTGRKGHIMKVYLTADQQQQEIKRQQKAIDYYKHDDLKRAYVKDAFKQLNNARHGFLVF